MDEASAAKLEELRLGAVSQGKEWLHRALNEIPKEELRVLAAAGGVQTHSNRNWLPVSELCNSLMKVLEPSTEVGFNQKCVLTWVVFVTGQTTVFLDVVPATTVSQNLSANHGFLQTTVFCICDGLSIS